METKSDARINNEIIDIVHIFQNFFRSEMRWQKVGMMEMCRGPVSWIMYWQIYSYGHLRPVLLLPAE